MLFLLGRMESGMIPICAIRYGFLLVMVVT